MDAAHSALKDLLGFRPGITISFVRDTSVTVNQDNLYHLIEGLRKAGLPE